MGGVGCLCSPGKVYLTFVEIINIVPFRRECGEFFVLYVGTAHELEGVLTESLVIGKVGVESVAQLLGGNILNIVIGSGRINADEVFKFSRVPLVDSLDNASDPVYRRDCLVVAVVDVSSQTFHESQRSSEIVPAIIVVPFFRPRLFKIVHTAAKFVTLESAVRIHVM